MSFAWFMFFQFVIATQCVELFPNFDTMVSHFVSKKAAHVYRSVQWWDLYSKRPEIKLNPAYAKYKLSVRVCNFVYGRLAVVNQKPCSRNLRYLKNINITNGIKFLMQGTRELSSYYQWNVTTGIQMARPVTVNIPVPPIEKELAHPEWEIDIRRPINKVTIGRQKFVFDSKPYEIPVSNVAKAEFYYINKESVVTWTAVVEFEGAVAVWYKKKYQHHNLWFYPLSEMANPQFLPDGHCRLRYAINGTFKWNQQLNATVKITRYELAEGSSDIEPDQEPVAVDYFIPNKLTLYGLKSVKLNYVDGKFFKNKILMKKTS